MHLDPISLTETEKEQDARRLLARLLDDSDVAELWPPDVIFDYVEAAGYAWTGDEWIVTGHRPAWDGFDDVDLVPTYS